MRSLLVPGLGALAGVCVCTGVHHLSSGMRRPKQAVHILLAILCFILSAYVFVKLGAYGSESAAELVRLRRWEISIAMVFFGAFSWFVAEYTGVRPRRVLIGLNALALAFFAINLALPYGISFTDMPRLQHLKLPWGEVVADLRVRGGSAAYQAGWLAIIMHFAFAAYAYQRQSRGGERQRALMLGAALGTFFGFFVFDYAVNREFIQFIHLAEFGFVALIVLMSVELGRELRAGGNALKESEARFRTLVDQSPFSIQLLAPDGRTLRVNPAWEKLWGVDVSALGGYNILSDQQLVQKGVMPYIERGFSGESTEIPPIVYNPQETPQVPGGPVRDRLIRAFIYPVKDDAGHVREVILMHEDITDRRRTEDVIRNIAAGVSAKTGEGFFRDLVIYLARVFDADYAFVGVLDERQRDSITTQAVCAHGRIVPNITYHLRGTPCANVMGQQTCAYPRGVQSLFPEDKLLADMGVEGYIGTPLFDVHGAPVGLIVVLDDKPLEHVEQVREILEIFAARISAEMQRIRAETELRASEARLSALLDIAPGAIITVDAQQNIIVFNREAQHVFGYSAGEVLGQPLERLIPARYRVAHRGAFLQFGAEQGPVRRMMGRPELRGLRKNGEEFPAEAAISKLATGGDPLYTVALQDITERKRIEDELRRHREELEEQVAERTAQLVAANKEVESFSYSVSHDLRAPLRAMHGFSAALQDDCGEHLDEQCKGHLQRIQAASNKMGRLIDDLLELSRITRAELQRSPVDLCAVARQVAQGLQQSAPERSVEWVIPESCQAQGDARLLAIALENLIGNAWKFTRNVEKARVEFGMSAENGEAVYYVRDNGAGFNMAYADKLFKPFQRLHSDGEFPGTGIGLSIVQRIIDRHGGRVWAKAAEGQGSTFCFVLPRSQDDAALT